MTNLEKYFEEILMIMAEAEQNGYCVVNKLRKGKCGKQSCDECRLVSLNWLLKEYEELSPERKLKKYEQIKGPYSEKQNLCEMQ